MSTSTLHVVLGAGGGTGSAVVQELAAQGHRVRAVTRRGGAQAPAGVERLAADVATPEGARAACAGAAVVYHCAQPPYHRWAQEFPAMNQAVVEGAAAAGTKLVFADNLYMYGPITGPIGDDTPQRPESRKGKVRLALAEDLLQAHQAGRLRVALGRSSDYYGPRGTASTSGDLVFGAVLKGQPVRWPGDPDLPRTRNYLADIARGLVVLGTREEADGRAWVLPAAPPLTTREFVERVAAEAGRPARLRPTSRTTMRVAGLFVPPARELPDIWYQFDRPWTVDASRFETAFGPSPVTSYEQGIPATLAWFRGRVS